MLWVIQIVAFVLAIVAGNAVGNSVGNGVVGFVAFLISWAVLGVLGRIVWAILYLAWEWFNENRPRRSPTRFM